MLELEVAVAELEVRGLEVLELEAVVEAVVEELEGVDE